MSTKTFEELDTVASGTENSRKNFQKYCKLLNFQNTNHSTENSRKSGIRIEQKENFQEKISQNLGTP